MTFFPVDKFRTATLAGVLTAVIIAIFWALGEALILPYWPGGSRFLGSLGWAVAVYVGCRTAQSRAGQARFPYAAERVAVLLFVLAAAGEGVTRLNSGSATISWASLLIRLSLGFLALTLATRRAGRKGRDETYRQRAHHFGKAVFEERE